MSAEANLTASEALEARLEGMSPRKQEALRLSHEYLMPNRVETWLAAGVPLVIDRREGYRFWDTDGRELLDFHLNGGTFNLGHRHPAVVQSLVEGVETLDVGNHHFPSGTRARLAQRLAQSAPAPLHYAIFTPSGSEANDVAIKSARWATGRRKVVSFEFGYHGASGLSGAAGNDDNARYFKSDFDDFVRIPFDDLDAVEEALKRGDVALLMAETLPATFGFPLPSAGYYQGVRELCDRYGTLLLVDEVQTGLGRSGRPWAIEHYDASPDMMITGKGLGGGLYPIGALLLSKQVGAWLAERGWGYVSTFGGSELGCHVALTALDLSLAESTQAKVEANAAYMRSGLDGLRERHAFFNDIRQLGVIFALGFDHSEGGLLMSRALYDAGLWAMFASFDRRYLQFKLGLLVDRAYCDEALSRVENALRAVGK